MGAGLVLVEDAFEVIGIHDFDLKQVFRHVFEHFAACVEDVERDRRGLVDQAADFEVDLANGVLAVNGVGRNAATEERRAAGFRPTLFTARTPFARSTSKSVA